MLMNKKLKELKKIYNGSVSQFSPSKSSLKSVRDICSSVSLPPEMSSDRIIREIRNK